MITEIAEFKIRPEDRTAFLEAINRAAVAFLAKSEGYLGHSIYASQESPGRVVLQVHYASDVLAGWLLAGTWVLCTVLIMESVSRWRGSQNRLVQA